MNRQQALIKYLQEEGPADWVRDIRDHYTRTGSFRPGDLRKLFGDPNKRVDMPRERETLADLIAAHRQG
jgi:hypothetical protein